MIYVYLVQTPDVRVIDILLPLLHLHEMSIEDLWYLHFNDFFGSEICSEKFEWSQIWRNLLDSNEIQSLLKR